MLRLTYQIAVGNNSGLMEASGKDKFVRPNEQRGTTPNKPVQMLS